MTQVAVTVTQVAVTVTQIAVTNDSMLKSILTVTTALCVEHMLSYYHRL